MKINSFIGTKISTHKKLYLLFFLYTSTITVFTRSYMNYNWSFLKLINNMSRYNY